MDKLPSTHSSYKEIVKQIYDNPSNSNIVKLLEEAGIEQKKLNSILVNDFLEESDRDYVVKFIEISSSNLNLT
jgi:DNA-binding ferritin-like protein (Dps family)